MKKKVHPHIYVDHASLTPLDPRVARVIAHANETWSANPSNIHTSAIKARTALSEARQTIARILGALSDEIVFTSGGTEGNNLAIVGAVTAYEVSKRSKKSKKPHIIISNIEHSSVLETCRFLETSDRIDLNYLKVNSQGLVNPKNLRTLIRPETILISVMLANNEIGTIEPIAEIAKEIRYYKKLNNKDTKTVYPLLHTDACQAINYLPLQCDSLGVDLLTFNGSKIYGPRGSGVLYVRRKTPLVSLIHGGDQERGLRPGTESVAHAVGLAEALAIASKLREKEAKRLKVLQAYCFALLKKNIPGMYINGDQNTRLPNNVNVSIPGVSSERLIIELDAKGIEASGKSACKSDDPEESYVIEALGEKRNGTLGSLRLSFGRSTTQKDITTIVHAICAIQERIAKWQA